MKTHPKRNIAALCIFECKGLQSKYHLTNGVELLVCFTRDPSGRVIKGMRVLREMSEAETLNQRPVVECKVNKCGQITPEEFAKFACK